MGKSRQVVLLEGDGIGPEIAAAVVFILKEAGANLQWERALIGERAVEQCGLPLPAETIEKIRSVGVALKGPVLTPIATSYRSVNVGLRKELDLYASYRPIRSIPGVETRFQNVDFVVIRENTEGLYAGLEHEIVPGVVTSLKVATRVACTRIAEFAFSFAERSGRKKVTAVHKANILKLSDGLALTCYREVANRYPTIEYDERIVDAVAMALVLRPEQFDVMVMENLYGDILSDLGAGLIGGLGLAPSGNFGPQVAVFEAVHGTAPDIAGKGIANPTALLLSAIELLKYIGEQDLAVRIEKAVLTTLREKLVITRDLGGRAATDEFARAVVAHL